MIVYLIRVVITNVDKTYHEENYGCTSYYVDEWKDHPDHIFFKMETVNDFLNTERVREKTLEIAKGYTTIFIQNINGKTIHKYKWGKPSEPDPEIKES